jgi:hypothetical protein
LGFDDQICCSPLPFRISYDQLNKSNTLIITMFLRLQFTCICHVLKRALLFNFPQNVMQTYRSIFFFLLFSEEVESNTHRLNAHWLIDNLFSLFSFFFNNSVPRSEFISMVILKYNKKFGVATLIEKSTIFMLEMEEDSC